MTPTAAAAAPSALSPTAIEDAYRRRRPTGEKVVRELAFQAVRLLLFVVLTMPALVLAVFAWLYMVLWSFGFPRLMEKLGKREPRKPVLKHDGYVSIPKELLPYESLLDFAIWRIPLYLWHLCGALSFAPAALLTRRCWVALPTDEELGRQVVGSYIVHSLNQVGEGDDARLMFDLGPWHNNTFFSGAVYSAAVLECRMDGTPVAITMTDGSVHRPGERLWALAKMHFVLTARAFAFQNIHSWVHFILPDLSAIAVHELPRDSVLSQLLTPHHRHTLRINQVRHGGSAVAATDTSKSRAVPWTPFPIDGMTFSRGNDAASSSFYGLEELAPQEGWSDFMVHWKETRAGEPLDRWDPPNHARNDVTVFHRWLWAYYEDVLAFVEEVWPEVEPELYDQWLATLVPWLPALADVKPTEALALVIWQVSFLHSADHHSIALHPDQGCHMIFRPFDPADAEHPERVWRSWDVVRSVCMDTIFSSPLYNPLQPLRMADVEHPFQTHQLRASSAAFRSRMRETEARLKREGNHIMNLNDVVVSLSF